MEKRPMETFPLQRVVLCLMILAELMLCTAKTVPGFVSIDCGSGMSAPYNDPETELTWENDQNYTTAGRDGYYPSGTNIYGLKTAVKTFRYFPEVRRRYCYEIPSTRSFLIRATFAALGTTVNLRAPVVKFNLAINATIWYTIDYSFQNSHHEVVTAEGIFFSPGGIINFCLIPETGIPFISSLEIRELDADGQMYTFYQRDKMYLTSIWRMNFAENDRHSGEIIRYPNDTYDRLWPSNVGGYARSSNSDEDFHYISNPSLQTKNTSADVNYVPSIVMSTAIVWTNDSVAQLSPSLGGGDASIQDIGYTYWIFYFQALGSRSEESTNILISLNSIEILVVNTSADSMLQKSISYFPLAFDYDDYDHEETVIQFRNERQSRNGTFLNAVEGYEQSFFNFSVIVDQDDRIIKFFRQTYNLSHWEGDPCLPVPFEELECSTKLITIGAARDIPLIAIASIKLSNLGQPIYVSNASADPFYFKQIQSLSLPHTHIDDEFFNILILNDSGAPLYSRGSGFTTPGILSLNFMDLSYNNMTRIPPTWSRYLSLNVLNLSKNAIQGDISALEMMQFQELNLSHNRITSLPASWGGAVNWSAETCTPSLNCLIKMDISHNLISENISSLSGLMEQHNSTLTELYLSNNNFSGMMDSDLFFTTLQGLKIAYLDHNRLGRVLDLTPWIASWQRQLENHSHIGGTFSFINNSIEQIRLSAKDLERDIHLFTKHFSYFNKSGVLLGGNPYCEGSKDANQFTHKYLCRYSVDEEIKVSRKKNLLPILLPTLLGGSLLIIITLSSFALVVRRLRKQVLELQKVQDELSRRKVQPPFFSYANIKIATRNFHNENKLGEGGFGVVYKGNLDDGSTIAVKKLINLTATQNSSVLNDFLNEVVLITGIKHKNLIQLRGCCIKDRERILVYDFAENGNLEQALHVNDASHTPLDLNTRISICFGIARGLTYLHDELQPRIVHRDIKPANILLDQNLNPKIADFGLARFAMEESAFQMTNKAGTWGYVAPEYELSDKMDVFSFGILVLEIMSGRRSIDYDLPTERSDLRTWAVKMYRSNTLLHLLPDDLRENCQHDQMTSLLKLAVKCTNLAPEHRPSMFEVLTTLTRIFIEQTDLTESGHQELLNSEDLHEPHRRLLNLHHDQGLATLTEFDEEDEFPLVLSNATVGTSPSPPLASFEIEGSPWPLTLSGRSSSSYARSACSELLSGSTEARSGQMASSTTTTIEH